MYCLSGYRIPPLVDFTALEVLFGDSGLRSLDNHPHEIPADQIRGDLDDLFDQVRY